MDKKDLLFEYNMDLKKIKVIWYTASHDDREHFLVNECHETYNQ